MRADRLLALLALLQARGQLSSREIALELEVSERTVHRDMEALSQAGIPVYALRGTKGGWTLPEGYRSRITGLTSGEIEALLLLHSSSVVTELGLHRQAKAAFGKLLSALPEAVRRNAEYVRQRIHIDGAGWHGDARTPAPLLTVCQEAVWAERKLNILYASRGENGAGPRPEERENRRLVSPLGLVAKTSIWYLIAYTEEGEPRTFRISRLREAELTDERFARPEPFDLASCWEQSMSRFVAGLPRYPATVRISEGSWEKFRAERFVRVLTHRPADGLPGWIEAEAEFNTLDSACGILLGCGREAEALAPAELRLAVREESAAIAALYAGDR